MYLFEVENLLIKIILTKVNNKFLFDKTATFFFFKVQNNRRK